MGEYSDREADTYFSYIAALNIDERNDLDEYLRGLPEFREWDDAGTLLRLNGKWPRAGIDRYADRGTPFCPRKSGKTRSRPSP